MFASKHAIDSKGNVLIQDPPIAQFLFQSTEASVILLVLRLMTAMQARCVSTTLGSSARHEGRTTRPIRDSHPILTGRIGRTMILELTGAGGGNDGD